MIIPRFSLSQDAATVTISIRAPYCNLQELDFTAEDNIFIFTCKPYYLRLNLPGLLEDTDQVKSSFNSDDGEFTFQCNKLNLGEHFSGLEFVTKLLCTKIEVHDGQQKIEIINDDDNSTSSDIKEVECEYGFAMRGGYNFNALSTEFGDIFEVDPYKVNLEERHKLRHSTEKQDFNVDHYIADFMDNSEISELLKLETPWNKLSTDAISFNPNELDFLKDLTNVDYSLTPLQVKYCHNGLLDILYAYCYDRRCTCFETTCESGWTISTLSATLCWFDGFQQTKEAVVCAFRRSLIYPLYRAYNFSDQVLRDLITLINLGEQFLIKCLIEIYNIFLQGDSGRYVFNNLFIKDYIVYIMKWDKALWKQTVNEVSNIVITKNDLGLNLLQIEDNMLDLNSAMDNLQISDTDSDDSTSEDSSLDSSDSDSSEADYSSESE